MSCIMKKNLKYIIGLVLIIVGILYYNNFAFISYHKPVKIDTTIIMSEGDYELEEDVRLEYQLTRLKRLNSLSLEVKENDDLVSLKDLTDLERLTLMPIDDNAVKNWDPKSVADLTSIKDLTLIGFTKEDLDCSFLGKLYNAESIISMNSNTWNWDFVKDLNKLTYIKIVMLDEYNDFKWDGLSFSRSLEEFEASGIYYDRILLESLEAIPSLKK